MGALRGRTESDWKMTINGEGAELWGATQGLHF